MRIKKDTEGPTWGTPSEAPDRTDKFTRKKRQLLEIAAALINKKGFFATSMNEIAAQLGINKASLYHYCRNKDEIALEIERLNYEYVLKVFSEIDEDDNSGMEKLRYFFYHYVELMTTPIGAAAVQLAAFPHSGEWEERYKAFFTDVDSKVREFLIEGQKDGSIAQLDSRWSDFVFFGALHWIPHWYSRDKNLQPEQVADELFKVICYGLEPR